METHKQKSDKNIFLDNLQEEWYAECVKQNLNNESHVLYGLWLQDKLQASEERVKELEGELLAKDTALGLDKKTVLSAMLKMGVELQELNSRHEAMMAELKKYNRMPSGEIFDNHVQSIINKYEKL